MSKPGLKIVMFLQVGERSRGVSGAPFGLAVVEGNGAADVVFGQHVLIMAFLIWTGLTNWKTS